MAVNGRTKATPRVMGRIPFGKYRGWSWSDIARHDPVYLDWIITNPNFGSDIQASAQQAMDGLGAWILAKDPDRPAPADTEPAPAASGFGRSGIPWLDDILVSAHTDTYLDDVV